MSNNENRRFYSIQTKTDDIRDDNYHNNYIKRNNNRNKRQKLKENSNNYDKYYEEDDLNIPNNKYFNQVNYYLITIFSLKKINMMKNYILTKIQTKITKIIQIKIILIIIRKNMEIDTIIIKRTMKIMIIF
jgi:hypothetical protein